jgi:hypothetical protein
MPSGWESNNRFANVDSEPSNSKGPIMDAMRLPKQFECWRHYKGGHRSLYQIIGTGHHTETNEAVVVYAEVGDEDYQAKPIFVRPLSMFLGTTDEHKPRFAFERETFR